MNSAEACPLSGILSVKASESITELFKYTLTNPSFWFPESFIRHTEFQTVECSKRDVGQIIVSGDHPANDH